MALPINTFLNELTTNSLRTTNMFELSVSSGYADVDKPLEHITMYGQGFSIPSRTQNYAEASFKGYAVPVPTNITMENEHTMTINADTEGVLRRAFLRWFDKTTNSDIGGGSFLEGDKQLAANSFIRIHLLGPDMQSEQEVYKLWGVKIQQVGALTVSNVDANIATFDVVFKSVYWTTEKVASGLLADQK